MKMIWKKEADELRQLNPKHILFLCVANSVRSQMAEGIARSLAPSSVQISSAGKQPSRVDSLAIEVLSEINIDIKSHISKSVEDIDSKNVDAIITLSTEEVCPDFLENAKRLHWGLPAPSNDIESFRNFRDELLSRLSYLFKNWNLEIDEKIRMAVRENYSKVALASSNCGCGTSCCGDVPADSKNVSAQLGYSKEEMENVPEGANMGLGCGNPKVFASLKKGETVLDLGSGGGFDCFIAAKEVGDTGRVIGVDMTPEMVNKARMNALKGNFTNVEFRLGEIEYLPVADSSVDVIISNCVINLSVDKKQTFKEAYRVLKSGGRLAISDIVKTATLPDEINKKMEAYTGCIAGASSIQEIEAILDEVGFEKINLSPKSESREFIKNWLPDGNIEDYIQSATIEAVKI